MLRIKKTHNFGKLVPESKNIRGPQAIFVNLKKGHRFGKEMKKRKEYRKKKNGQKKRLKTSK